MANKTENAETPSSDNEFQKVSPANVEAVNKAEDRSLYAPHKKFIRKERKENSEQQNGL
ncbi:MAG: hypothetical protein JKY84_08695 [Emcibacteraceae bacterium]|nr:hypothetical protein [Emcibacteraceae bacterium]